MKTIERIEYLKRAVATRLGLAVNSLTARSKRRLLLTVGCLVTCICLFMITSPFHKKGSVIVIPKGDIPTTIIPPEPLLSVEDFQMLRDFEQIMDSLKLYDNKTYTEILHDRKGLLDSVKMLLRLQP